MAIFMSLLPVILKIISWGFEKKYLSDEQRKAFLNFVQTLSTRPNESKKSMDAFEKLHARLKEK